MSVNAEQFTRISEAPGFIAALDQSGGSTPKALRAYGVADSEYADDRQMFDFIHEFRTRIVTSPAFTGEKVLAAILFQNTLDREIEGKNSAAYLWEDRGVVPFLKIDKGLAPVEDDVQLMKPIPGLDETLAAARQKGVFGTKERSFIAHANSRGIAAVLDQQFAVGRQVAFAGLVPILEPEVDIHANDKEQAEELLKAGILERLERVDDARPVMLKLSIPSVDDFYRELVDHPKVVRVVALSGGYSQADANDRLSRNPGVIASFSRALTEGLTRDLSDADFDARLAASIDAIYRASIA